MHDGARNANRRMPVRSLGTIVWREVKGSLPMRSRTGQWAWTPCGAIHEILHLRLWSAQQAWNAFEYHGVVYGYFMACRARSPLTTWISEANRGLRS